MRRAAAATLIATTTVIAACGGALSRTTGTPTVTPNPYSLTATAYATYLAGSATPEPTPTPIDVRTIEQQIRRCLADATLDDPGAAATRLRDCLAGRDIHVATAGVGGPVPLVLVERSDLSTCRPDDFVAWRAHASWRVQSLEPLPPGEFRGLLLPPGSAAGVLREASGGQTVRLAAIAGIYCGSGPGTVPVLFALDGDAWHLAWTPRGTELLELSDMSSAFVGDGIDTVSVHGAAWDIRIMGDPRSHIFFESHPGPHRYIDERWIRDGDRYVLAEKRVEPSAYNTLVEFIYRLSTGDDAGAAELLADPSLLDTAKQLGLIQQPLGQQWMSDAWKECCGPIHITSKDASGALPPTRKAGPPQDTVVSFEQRGGDWLIAGISPATEPAPRPAISPLATPTG